MEMPHCVDSYTSLCKWQHAIQLKYSVLLIFFNIIAFEFSVWANISIILHSQKANLKMYVVVLVQVIMQMDCL